MAARFWQELAHPDFAALDRERTVAVLPVAAVEQHGPHLPVGVDTIINQGILARAMALAESGPPVLVLPALSIGLSPEHRDFPGTLTLTAATMLRLVSEVAAGVVRVGISKLLFFNSHGGQPQLLELAAQELRTDHAMTAMVVNSWRLMRAAELFPASEIRDGILGSEQAIGNVADKLADLYGKVDAFANVHERIPVDAHVRDERHLAEIEAVWGAAPDLANFRRKVLTTPGFVRPLDMTASGHQGRPALLYQAGDGTVLQPAMLRP